jgi:hypothetical protein
VSGFQYAMLGVGSLAALCGVLMLVMRLRTLVSGRVADGVVVGEKLETHSGDEHSGLSKVSAAVYEFRHEGKTYRCTSSLATSRKMARGTRVRVRYLPSDPQSSAEIDSVGAMWGFPAIALVFGVVAIAIGLNAK